METSIAAGRVRRRVNYFKEGNRDFAILPHSDILRIDRNNGKINGLMEENRLVTVSEMSVAIRIGHHAVKEMMEILG